MAKRRMTAKQKKALAKGRRSPGALRFKAKLKAKAK